MQAAINFRDRYHVPIYCGEFGVYCVTAPKEDRQQWHQDMVELFREYGIGYALWEYRGNFGLLDEETGEPNRELVETIAYRSAN